MDELTLTDADLAATYKRFIRSGVTDLSLLHHLFLPLPKRLAGMIELYGGPLDGYCFRPCLQYKTTGVIIFPCSDGTKHRYKRGAFDNGFYYYDAEASGHDG